MNYIERLGFEHDAPAAVVFDLDGTLWLSGVPLPGAVEFVDMVRGSGAVVMAATNISITTPEQVRQQLVQCGLLLEGENVVTAGAAVANALVDDGVRTAAVLGGQGLHEAVLARGITVKRVDDIDVHQWSDLDPANALVLGGWPDATLRDIESVGRLAAAGVPLYVTSLEAGFPSGNGWQAGAGMMIAAARALHQFEVIVCGKPSKRYAAAVRALLDDRSPAGSILVIGDSQLADIGLAHELGARSIWLSRGQAANPDFPAPTHTVVLLAELVNK